MKILIVVDMQKDFIDGALGTKEAQAIVPLCRDKIAAFEGLVLYTQDTHSEAYLTTQEGQKLPIAHCVKGTDGWEINPLIAEALAEKKAKPFEKGTFGSLELALWLQKVKADEEKNGGQLEEIELIGLCTDICVITNALVIKAALPEIPIRVDSACCAGVTPESHKNALAAMSQCQIEII